jgi:hypothetical protein
MIDTGDLVFMQHNCFKAFSVSEICNCYFANFSGNILRKFGLRNCGWDSIGLIVRDKQGARVLFYFYNRLYDLEYDEFLRIPFFEDIALRKLVTSNKAVGFVGIQFRSGIDKLYNEKKKAFIIGNYENGVNIVLDYWLKSGLIEEQNSAIRKIEEIDVCDPKVFKHDSSKYSEPIILRTKMSKNEIERY